MEHARSLTTPLLPLLSSPTLPFSASYFFVALPPSLALPPPLALPPFPLHLCLSSLTLYLFLLAGLDR